MMAEDIQTKDICPKVRHVWQLTVINYLHFRLCIFCTQTEKSLNVQMYIAPNYCRILYQKRKTHSCCGKLWIWYKLTVHSLDLWAHCQHTHPQASHGWPQDHYFKIHVLHHNPRLFLALILTWSSLESKTEHMTQLVNKKAELWALQ